MLSGSRIFRAAARAARAARLPFGAPLARALAGKASDVAKAGGDAPKDLASVLTREIAFEKEDESAAGSLAELREALAADWALDEAAGRARFSLSKKAGAQTVRVDLDITPMPSDAAWSMDRLPAT
jgi:hypothetical protein